MYEKTKTTAAEVALNKSIIIQQITQTQREAVAAVKTAGGAHTHTRDNHSNDNNNDYKLFEALKLIRIIYTVLSKIALMLYAEANM